MADLIAPLLSGLILGLGGSVHCVGMCGPLIAALAQHSGSPQHAVQRLGWHTAGRLTTYAGLGLAAGSIGRSFELLGIQRWFTITLGILILVGPALHRPLLKWNPVTALLFRLSQTLQAQQRQRAQLTGYATGLAHGFLPCGFVYLALAAGASTAHPLSSASLMFGFGLGTIPLLSLVHQFAARAGLGLRRWQRILTPWFIAITAGLLILRGLELGIPYISPGGVGTAQPSCCPTETSSRTENPIFQSTGESRTSPSHVFANAAT